jgi:hypothetical protein
MYYPLSEILESQYTNGNEYIEKNSLKPYKGFYYSTTDGRVFSGKTYTPKAIELIKVTKPLRDESVNSPKYNTPQPEERDYENGFMIRYAIKRVNCGPDTIKEVTKEDYNRLINNPLYIRVAFRWVLTGELFDDMSNPEYPIQGIVSTNQRTVSDLEKTMSGISLFFQNYSQYAR